MAEPQLIDISPLISPRTAVFPGDRKFERNVVMDLAKGDNLTLSSITTTVHIGAHADAPSHYSKSGEAISERELSYYYGKVQVIEVAAQPFERIGAEDVTVEILAPRVLFKTGSFPDPAQWNDDFNSLSAQLIQMLHSKGVILVGIDTPSVDPAPAKELLSHQAIANHDMAILEGLDLSQVEAGEYILSAFPLKIAGADASPVRAVLIRN